MVVTRAIKSFCRLLSLNVIRLIRSTAKSNLTSASDAKRMRIVVVRGASVPVRESGLSAYVARSLVADPDALISSIDIGRKSR